MENKGFENRLTGGDLVLIHQNSPAAGGERAYVYETYPDFDEKGELGVSLITESGRDTGGWSRKEQRKFLTLLPRTYYHGTGWDYTFKNVSQLAEDFRTGVFDKVFKGTN